MKLLFKTLLLFFIFFKVNLIGMTKDKSDNKIGLSKVLRLNLPYNISKRNVCLDSKNNQCFFIKKTDTVRNIFLNADRCEHIPVTNLELIVFNLNNKSEKSILNLGLKQDTHTSQFAVNGNNNRLVGIDRQCILHIYELDSLRELKTIQLNKPENKNRFLNFSHDGKHLAIAYDSKITIYDANNCDFIQSINNLGQVRMIFNAQSNKIICGNGLEKGLYELSWNGKTYSNSTLVYEKTENYFRHMLLFNNESLLVKGSKNKQCFFNLQKGSREIRDDFALFAYNNNKNIIAHGKRDGCVTISNANQFIDSKNNIKTDIKNCSFINFDCSENNLVKLKNNKNENSSSIKIYNIESIISRLKLTSSNEILIEAKKEQN